MQADIRQPLRKHLPYLTQAKLDNINETNTVQCIIKVFADVLGAAGTLDLNREAHMEGKFIDLMVNTNVAIRLHVEAKSLRRGAETLHDRAIEQAPAYASRNNHRWVLLTNGTTWDLYHHSSDSFGDSGVDYEHLLIDLANANDRTPIGRGNRDAEPEDSPTNCQ